LIPRHVGHGFAFVAATFRWTPFPLLGVEFVTPACLPVGGHLAGSFSFCLIRRVLDAPIPDSAP